MKKTVLLFIIISLFLIGCVNPFAPTGLIGFITLDDSSATQEGVDDLVLANNQFALDYYNKIDTGKNLFFSPFSISTALAMTYEGAKEETAQEMRNVFHFPSDDIARRSSFARIYNTLNETASKGNYAFNIANSIWVEQTYNFREDYFNTIKNYYYGKVNSVDFKNNFEELRININTWVSEKTNSKIQNILQPNSLNKDVAFVIVNAIYFKGDWLEKFEESNTQIKDFFVSENNTKQVEMMNATEKYNYFSDENFQYLELPYKGEDISMIIILPGQVDESEYYEEEKEVSNEIIYDFNLPTAEYLFSLKEKMRSREVNLNLPKFKMETEYDMVKDFNDMGMKLAFKEWEADFSGMCDMNPNQNIYISKIIHKAFVEVNEEGTEAAAATVVIGMMVTSAAPSKPIEFNANHPFAFYIIDNTTNEILFLGKVVEPSN